MPHLCGPRRTSMEPSSSSGAAADGASGGADQAAGDGAGGAGERANVPNSSAKSLKDAVRQTVFVSGLPPTKDYNPAAQRPEGLPQIVPDEPVSSELASEVCDCIRYPLVAQFTWDSLTSLVEACKRERMKSSKQLRTMATTTQIWCTRCNCAGHYAKDCSNFSFFRQSVAERRVEAARRKAEWEARQSEKERKKAEWEAKQAEREAKRAERKQLDVQSIADSEVSTSASTIDEKEVERMIGMDKEVRKWSKLLRDIGKLEGLRDLDALQKAKLDRKQSVAAELDSAKFRAELRARNELRRQPL